MGAVEVSSEGVSVAGVIVAYITSLPGRPNAKKVFILHWEDAGIVIP